MRLGRQVHGACVENGLVVGLTLENRGGLQHMIFSGSLGRLLAEHWVLR